MQPSDFSPNSAVDLGARKAALEREAKQRAEEATEAKSAFLANMSHELRTPLNSVIGFSELMYDELPGKLNDKQKEYVKDIWESGKHLLNVINDVLDVAKLDANKMELESIDVAPAQFLNDILTLMRPKAQEKGLALDVEFASRLPELVQTDPTRLRQILLNLLGNAVKFSPAGGVVRAGVTPRGEDWVGTVEDQGPGIPAEDLPRVFELATRVGVRQRGLPVRVLHVVELLDEAYTRESTQAPE